MGLPKSCCCCLDLHIGCFILSAFSCIGYASTLVDTILNFEASKESQSEGGEVWYGTIAVWSVIGIFTVICLVIGIAIVRQVDFFLDFNFIFSEQFRIG